MQNVVTQINNLQGYIIIGILVAILILFIMIIVILKSLEKLENRYRRIMRGVDNKNLEQLVLGYLDEIDKVKGENDYIKGLCKGFDSRLKSCIQRVSMVRYRAFEDVGSDLSFSIALLDENNDGIIVTGIYGRNESTTYAKPIDRGISRYDLSEEENKVLQECINKTLK